MPHQCLDYQSLAPVVIQGHLDIVNMMGQMGMLWWVSSTVMCIGILKSAWTYRDKGGKELPRSIIWLITLFLGSIMFFGAACAIAVVQLEEEYQHIVGPVLLQQLPGTAMFSMVARGFVIGTSSFIIVGICWVYILTEKFKESSQEAFYKETRHDR